MIRELHQIRTEAGKTQQEVAALLGLTQSDVATLESKSISALKIDEFRRFAAACGVELVFNIQFKS